MKGKLFLVAIICWTTIVAEAQQPNPTTERFEFYNDFWINLHHYLYQQAKGSQHRHLEEDGLALVDIGEAHALAGLLPEEATRLEKAIAYYRVHLIDKGLRRDLGDIRIWFQEQHGKASIADTSFSATFTRLLNDAASAYRSSLWPVHQRQNDHVIQQYLETIKSLEDKVISRMEELAHYQWPDVPLVRVDLTAYANYAGAYTASEPELNIFLSTLDPINNTTSFIESVFHEGCHLLYNFQDSPFRGAIYHKSKEMGLKFPRNLWHASLFYLCGRVVQDELGKRDTPHKLQMDVLHIFTDYNTEEFRVILEGYYRNEYDMKACVNELLESLQNNDEN